MSRSKTDSSPDHKPHHVKKVTLKQRSDFLKLPKDKDRQSEFSSDTPGSKEHHHHQQKGPVVQLENTFKMAPDDGKVFQSYKVERVMKDTLESKLKDATYHADRCSKLAQELCSQIKERTKDIGFHRYKLITHVIVGQDTEQSVQMASRCLWNHATDNFAAATYRNNSVYAIAVVYGIYLD